MPLRPPRSLSAQFFGTTAALLPAPSCLGLDDSYAAGRTGWEHALTEKKPQERSEAKSPGVAAPSTAVPRLPLVLLPRQRAKSRCGVLDAMDA